MRLSEDEKGENVIYKSIRTDIVIEADESAILTSKIPIFPNEVGILSNESLNLESKAPIKANETPIEVNDDPISRKCD